MPPAGPPSAEPHDAPTPHAPSGGGGDEPTPGGGGVGVEGSFTLWHGRFGDSPDGALRALNDSLAFDRRMFREDIAGSRAHVRMLASVGLLSEAERDEICDALDQVQAELEAEFAAGTFVAAPGDEDIHTVVERRVSEITPAGAKMHTGRSRNDQVAADLRLWTRTALTETAELVLRLQHTLLAQAEAAGDAVLPGYTHLQQAQPVALAHHLLAHGWALARDFDRLCAARSSADVSPLGAGALAGSSLPLDPALTAAELGFAAVFENSLDAVSDRDFALDALYALAVLGVHLSRLGEEMVLWASSEFGFAVLDDRHATGSSMMPQKKNPDVAELARAKSGRQIGHLTGLLATLKALPLAYAKDLQEDKEHLFDAFDTANLTLAALEPMLATTTFDTKKMAQAADSPYAAATDLAEWLVAQGTPFRQAHSEIADLVRQCLNQLPTQNKNAKQHDDTGPAEHAAQNDAAGQVEDAGQDARGGQEENAGQDARDGKNEGAGQNEHAGQDARAVLTSLVEAHPDLGPEAAKLLTSGASAQSRNTPGGASPKAVAIQLQRFESHLTKAQSHLQSRQPTEAPPSK